MSKLRTSKSDFSQYSSTGAGGEAGHRIRIRSLNLLVWIKRLAEMILVPVAVERNINNVMEGTGVKVRMSAPTCNQSFTVLPQWLSVSCEYSSC